MARETDIGPCRRFASKIAKAQGVEPNLVTGFTLQVYGSGETVLNLQMVPTPEVVALLDSDQQDEEAPTDD